jgi:hypothetical protein
MNFKNQAQRQNKRSAHPWLRTIYLLYNWVGLSIIAGTSKMLS